jgi:hypothetical protein
MRIRIVQTPCNTDLDGIDLRHYQVGYEYDIGSTVASVLVAEGWAEPVPIDAPPAPVPFGPDDPFVTRVLDRNHPPNLIKEQHPPFLDPDKALDIRFRRRKRR